MTADATKAADKIRGLEAGVDRVPAAEQDGLGLGLGDAYLAAGDPAAAGRVWRGVADLAPRTWTCGCGCSGWRWRRRRRTRR